MSSRNRTGLLLAISLGLPISCGGQHGLPPAPAEITVRTAVAESRAVKRIRSYPGITSSARPVIISARVTGFLEKQHAADGASVKAGDLLYSIDARPYQAALQQAQATLGQARAQVPGATAARDLASLEVERNRPLAATGAISQQSFDQLPTKLIQAEAQLSAAEATVEAALAQVAMAELNLSYCQVTAPMDGAFGATRAYEGQMVGPGYTVQLNELLQLDPMWIDFAPSSTEWPLVREQLERGTINARVSYGGDEAISVDGTVTFVSNAADQSTSTLPMRVTFPNPRGEFRAGTFSEVSLDLGEIPGVVLIPSTALVPREADFHVWRVKADSTVETLRVKAGVRDGEFVGITEGLAPGDRIVSAGTQKLSGGAKVREEAPAAVSSAGSGE